VALRGGMAHFRRPDSRHPWAWRCAMTIGPAVAQGRSTGGAQCSAVRIVQWSGGGHRLAGGEPVPGPTLTVLLDAVRLQEGRIHRCDGGQGGSALRRRLDPDFLDRISLLTLRLPPLREVCDELPWLWEATHQEAGRRSGVDEHRARLDAALHRRIVASPYASSTASSPGCAGESP